MDKLVVFDLDGTVLDTLFDLTDAMNKTMCQFGFEEITTAQMRRVIGGSSEDMVRISMGVDNNYHKLKEATQFYAQTYKNSGSPKTMVFRGLKEVFFDLRRRGFKLAILTNKPEDELFPLKQKHLNSIGFDKIVGLDDGIIPKPDPTELLKIMKEFDANARHTYFIGDGETDILTAVNAGVHAIGVSWGNRDTEELLDCGAEQVASSPYDLVQIIK